MQHEPSLEFYRALWLQQTVTVYRSRPARERVSLGHHAHATCHQNKIFGRTEAIRRTRSFAKYTSLKTRKWKKSIKLTCYSVIDRHRVVRMAAGSTQPHRASRKPSCTTPNGEPPPLARDCPEDCEYACVRKPRRLVWEETYPLTGTTAWLTTARLALGF